MRVLLDECVGPGIRSFIADHEVATVAHLGRKALGDGQILRLAQGDFDVFITLDAVLSFNTTWNNCLSVS